MNIVTQIMKKSVAKTQVMTKFSTKISDIVNKNHQNHLHTFNFFWIIEISYIKLSCRFFGYFELKQTMTFCAFKCLYSAKGWTFARFPFQQIILSILLSKLTQIVRKLVAIMQPASQSNSLDWMSLLIYGRCYRTENQVYHLDNLSSSLAAGGCMAQR